MKTEIPSLNSATDALDCAGQKEQFGAKGDSETALLKAGWLLDQSQLSANEYSAAIDALLWATDDPRPWTPKVERAYRGFSPREKKLLRSLTLYFYGHAGLHEQVISLAPRRFCNLVELAFVMRANLELGKLPQAQRLVAECLAGIEWAEFPEMKRWLIECLEDFLSKVAASLPNAEVSEEVRYG